jgi:hypothetical protein
MDANNDPYYRHLSKKKDQLIRSESWDADDLTGSEQEEPADPDEIKRQQLIKVAIRLYEPWDQDNDTTYSEVAAAIDERGKSWVGNRIKEWRDGEHRGLVPDPTEAES